MDTKGYLVLADGSVFVGKLLNGFSEPFVGELVFSTAMTGYTEILSDPSFFNQIVILTSAEIGNYGVSRDDAQSKSIMAQALVVRNFTQQSYSWREDCSLLQWLSEEKKPVLVGIDTRALVAHLRTKGAMMAAIGNHGTAVSALLSAARTAAPMAGQHLSPQVSVSKPELFIDKAIKSESLYRIVVMDFGVKREILRCLKRHHAEVVMVPQNISVQELWALEPDGLCLSNGPGDPQMEYQAVQTVKKLLGELPIFGICLGHQILAQALELSTYKLKCGHRGSNQPVMSRDGKIIISAQNHGFAVNDDEMTMLGDINLLDGTNEGLYVPKLRAFSVQFHPEGAPGPKDAAHYFQSFIDMIEESKRAHFNKGFDKAFVGEEREA